MATIITKLAQGHALYELHESCAREPDSLQYFPISFMESAEREAFESPDTLDVWPEVGSRAMQRIIEGTDMEPGGWINVQAGRYRFHAAVSYNVEIRIVIHEYLACHIQWEY